MAQGKALLAAVAVCLADAVFAAEGEAAFTEAPPLQVVRSFNNPDAPLRIHHVAAEKDFLWLATSQGLVRFDGEHLHAIDSAPVSQVAVDEQGWIWTAGKAGLRAHRRGEWRNVQRGDFSSVVTRPGEIVASDGDVWRGNIKGVSRVDGLHANGPLNLDGKQVVWFACGTEVCGLLPSGETRRIGAASGLPTRQWIAAVQDDAGVMWAWDVGELVQLVGQRPVVRRVYLGAAASERSMHVTLDRTGRVWFDGNAWVDRKGEYFRALWNPSVDFHGQSYVENSSGAVWMGSWTSGISLLASKPWVTGWPTGPLFPGEPTMVTRSASGIVGSTSAGVARHEAASGKWRLLANQDSHRPALAVAGSRDGNLFVVFRDHGVVKLGQDGRRLATLYAGSPLGIDYRVFHRDQAGQLWLGAKRQLYRVDEVQSKLEAFPLPVLNDNPVAFAKDQDGTDWLGYEGGIAKRTAIGWELVVPASTLASTRVRSIAVGPGPAFWVCYRATAPFSLMTKAGSGWKRQDFGIEAGYAPGITWSLLRDRRGWIWRGTEDGLFVSDGVHLAADDWVKLTAVHNLPSPSIAHLGLTEDADGAIWVSTERGVAKIQPSAAWFAEVRTNPRLTRVTWKGVESLWPDQTLRLSGEGALELDFARWPGMSPRALPIEYRLDSVDDDWRKTTKGKARYENLTAGSYRFAMRAPGGPETVVSLQVGSRIPWSSIGGGAAVLTALVAAWRNVRRRRMRRGYEHFVVTDSEERESLATGSLIDGRYRISRKLGEGGFAQVFLAEDVRTGQITAVKVFRPEELEGWQRKRFEAEVDALSKLRHPGIVELLDHGTHAGKTPYLVMCYVAGPTLRDELDRRRPSATTTARWIGQISEALAAAHALNILHRDLKPENVIIAAIGKPDEHAVLLDFGAAAIKEPGDGQLSFSMPVSRSYAAPERFQGRSSPATDVYALAAMAFEMLSGVTYGTLNDRSSEQVRRAVQLHPSTLADVLLRGLAFDPDQRTQSIKEFTDEFVRALRSEA